MGGNSDAGGRLCIGSAAYGVVKACKLYRTYLCESAWRRGLYGRSKGMGEWHYSCSHLDTQCCAVLYVESIAGRLLCSLTYLSSYRMPISIRPMALPMGFRNGACLPA